MKVIQPIDTEQNLVVRARENAASVDLEVRNAMTDVTTTYSGVSTTYLNGLLTIPFTHDVSEGDTYNMVVKNGSGDVIHRVRAYATTKTPQDFKYFE